MFWKEPIKTIFKSIISILSNKRAEIRFRRIKRPQNNEDLATWLKYYMVQRDISQEKLVEYSRLNPLTVDMILNGKSKHPHLEHLVAIILVLQLSDQQAKVLISRAGLAFSPCDDLHQTYLKLIAIYHFRRDSEIKKDDDHLKDGENYLVQADNFLTKKGYKPLPIELNTRPPHKKPITASKSKTPH